MIWVVTTAGDITGIQWAETRHAAIYPTTLKASPSTKDSPAPNQINIVERTQAWVRSSNTDLETLGSYSSYVVGSALIYELGALEWNSLVRAPFSGASVQCLLS